MCTNLSNQIGNDLPKHDSFTVIMTSKMAAAFKRNRTVNVAVVYNDGEQVFKAHLSVRTDDLRPGITHTSVQRETLTRISCDFAVSAAKFIDDSRMSDDKLARVYSEHLRRRLYDSLEYADREFITAAERILTKAYRTNLDLVEDMFSSNWSDGKYCRFGIIDGIANYKTAKADLISLKNLYKDDKSSVMEKYFSGLSLSTIDKLIRACDKHLDAEVKAATESCDITNKPIVNVGEEVPE
jgi:hypothetical protein